MGKWNDEVTKRMIAMQNRERADKARRTERIPSRMMYKVARDLRGGTPDESVQHPNYLPDDWKRELGEIE